MYDGIRARWFEDKDLPHRAWVLKTLRAQLTGEFYDVLPHEFHQEFTNQTNGEYIPIDSRRPSVRYNLPALIVRDSIGLLFSEGHFPELEVEDEGAEDEDGGVQDWLKDIANEVNLKQVMLDAAWRGSVGSVCIWVRLLKTRVFLRVLETEYLTPFWREDEPDKLERVVELKKVTGAALKVYLPGAYDGLSDDKEYWFRREWTTTEEVWFRPWLVRDSRVDRKKPAGPVRDEDRTRSHGLGFVPMVWIKNLPGGDDIDGRCTFHDARHTTVEIDYKLSHGGRGLKYSSDPILAIQDPTNDPSGKVLGGGNALVLNETGDAKFLEIAGTANAAVLEYVRQLREMVLEVVGGNRAPADKVIAPSGRALEMLNHALIMLTDQLRSTYGDGGLKAVADMLVEMRRRQPMTVFGKPIPMPPESVHIRLRWPQWYAPTPDDAFALSNALVGYITAGVLPREEVTRLIAADFNLADPERTAEEAEAERAADADADVARQVQVTAAQRAADQTKEAA